LQRDQKKYFDALKRYENKFTSKEAQDYRMLFKRHKDYEDLDKLSMERLTNLYEKYYISRERKSFDDIFKKPDEEPQ